MVFNRVIELTDQQYKDEVRKREEFLMLTGEDRLPGVQPSALLAAPSTATGGGSR